MLVLCGLFLPGPAQRRAPAVPLGGRLPACEQGCQPGRVAGLPQNLDYFKGPLHVDRVRAWRAAHPGWRRPGPPERGVLQDSLIAQLPDAIEQILDRGVPPKSPAELALQDSLNPSTALLAGLIAHLFELTLQDDFDSTTRRLVQRGQDLMRGQQPR